jgi:hypothetical protein
MTARVYRLPASGLSRAGFDGALDRLEEASRIASYDLLIGANQTGPTLWMLPQRAAGSPDDRWRGA